MVIGYVEVTILVFLAALVQQINSRWEGINTDDVTILVFLAALVQRQKLREIQSQSRKLQSLFFWQL